MSLGGRKKMRKHSIEEVLEYLLQQEDLSKAIKNAYSSFINPTEVKPFEKEKSKSLFIEGDTVYVLSFASEMPFGVSCEGVVDEIYEDRSVSVKVAEDIYEVHKPDHISFAPFSVHDAGFTQVRPKYQPKAGDWGYFYNSSQAVKGFYYGKLYSIKEQELETLYIAEGANRYYYFSLEPPVLEEGIPSPFTL